MDARKAALLQKRNVFVNFFSDGILRCLYKCTGSVHASVQARDIICHLVNISDIHTEIKAPAFSFCFRALAFFLGTRLYIPIFLFFLFTARKSRKAVIYHQETLHQDPMCCSIKVLHYYYMNNYYTARQMINQYDRH